MPRVSLTLRADVPTFLVDPEKGVSGTPCGIYTRDIEAMQPLSHEILENNLSTGTCRMRVQKASIEKYRGFFDESRVMAEDTGNGWRFTYHVSGGTAAELFLKKMSWTIRVHGNVRDVTGLEQQHDGTWLFQGDFEKYKHTHISWMVPN